MSASMRPLLLYDLLAPEFLGGFTFPSYIDQYLSLLAVSGLTMTSDDADGAYTGGVLYTGTVYFPSAPGSAPPVTTHTDPSGAVFQWSDVNFQFRLRTWRQGSSDLQTVVNTVSGITNGSNTIQGLFNNFDPSNGAVLSSPDYPGLQFRLELLVSVLTFHMGSDWVPGVMDATYHVVQDTTSASTDVKILLPTITLCYEQVENFSTAPTFHLESWGGSGFDAPSDLGSGQLVTMQPPLAMNTNKRVAFSVQNILLDLDPNNTPYEILDMFGVAAGFTGVYIKAMQFYYSDEDKDFAFNISVQDALISFQGQVWLEAELDLMFDPASHPQSGGLVVTPTFLADNQPLQSNDSTQQTADPVDNNNVVYQGGSITAPGNVYIQLQATGGTAPYTYAVDYTSSAAGSSVVHMWDTTQNQAYFTPPTAAPLTANDSGTLVITVTDSTAGTPMKYTNTYTMNIAPITAAMPDGAPEDNAANPADALATFVPDSAPAGAPASYQIDFTPNPSGTIETLMILGCPNPKLTVTITPATGPAGAPEQVNVSPSGQAIIEVDPGASIAVSVDYPAQPSPSGTYNLYFNYDGPGSDGSVTSYTAGVPSPDDPIFDGNVIPADIQGDGESHTGGDALTYWVKTALDMTQDITITGQASYEGYEGTAPHNLTLSQRRANVAQAFVNAANPTGTVTAAGNGQDQAQSSGSVSNPQDRVATVTGTPVQGAAECTLTGTLARAASNTPPAPPAPQATTPPNTPPAGSNSKKPPSLKRLSFRIRLEKNVPVMLEISGEIDFQQQTQSALQSASGNSSGNLGLQNNNPGATGNPNAGPSVVDFLLNVTYDTATCNLTETLTLGSGPGPSNGLLQMTNGPAGSYDTFKNIMGAVMIFTPIINAATTALDPASAGEWTDIALSLGIPVTIGALGWINTTKITLYGGTLIARENVPSGLSSAKFTAASLTFDYGVSFRIDIDPLNIHSSRDLSVRYKAFGFSLNFAGTPAFQFVFDTSKGYELDLSDPSLFNLPSPLADLLKIAGARIAQFNPLTIEVDLVIKQDLGVITVDEFLIKVPLDGSAPMILPSGIHVNLPGVLTGGGQVNIQQGSFEGSFDLTLVALSLRVAASVGVSSVTSPDGRKATAFYLGMEVDFPMPIILGDTGLGIFGFFGLFAMHYMRNLPTVPAGDVYGPDLQWLIDANGQPQSLLPVPGSNDPNQNPENQNWIPNLGSWGFGVGLLLGTVDGFLLTMRGMFILTLPGPQIIITINLKFISDIDSADGGIATDSLTVGILGILDLDFNLGQITIGVSINLAVQDLISIVVPISIFFSWTDPSTWHFWLGTTTTPISANILGIVKGSGYFMFGGQAIKPFPPGGTGSLPGVAVAVGFSASIIWGSESIDIYLAVVIGADLGVSFSPALFISGQITLSGKLQLLIISIGASGTFQIAAGTSPALFYMNVQVCGSVSFFFFSVSACCGFSIGTTPPPPPPPPLVSRMYLQSYAPVIPSGQGGERPIDASLGNGLETVTTPSALNTLPNGATPNNPPVAGNDPNNLVVVPIDTVPVLQLDYAADASTMTSTFTEAVPQCPMLPTPYGSNSVSLGGGRTAVYSLTSLSISAVQVGSLNAVNPPLKPGQPAVPVVWRKNTPPGNHTATRVDLAMFSRDPNIASHALERSTTLTNQQTSLWSGLCDPVAPPACVLWTFCKQRIDCPQTTWNLTGIPVPDPPGTTRSSPVPTAMEVVAPSYGNAAALIAALSPLFGGNAFQPAQVIGLGSDDDRSKCFRGLELPEIIETNLTLAIGPRPVYEPGAGTPIIENAAAAARLRALEDKWRWVRLNVGASTQVSLYMAVDPALAAVSFDAFGDTSGLGLFNGAFDIDVDLDLMKAANRLTPIHPVAQQRPGAADHVTSKIVIRERDVHGTMLRESTLASLGPNLVMGTIGLPSTWIDPAGPWWGEIAKTALYFNAALQTLSKIFVQFTPLATTTVVEVAVVGPVLTHRPTVVIGAVQACSQAEQNRATVALQVQAGQISTLEGYLSGGAPVPLLIPDTEYTITLGYNVTTTEKDGTQTNYTGIQQGFTFQTDNAPPAALSPWVLACLPANQEEDVFYEDPVTIAFNDEEALQLFAAYGEQLVLQLHAADGLNDPSQTVQQTGQVSAIGPAGYDSLLNLINQKMVPCVGSVSGYNNSQFTAAVALRPKMAYTLDIVMDPAPAVPPVSQGQQPVPVTPLYRTRFTTSKYASLNDLATEVGTSRIMHGNLSGPLTSLSVLMSGTSTQVTDQAIEAAFIASGEQALPAAADNTITVYWIPGPGNGPYVPHCILIDCMEPLWRTRQEPTLVPVDPSDPSFVIVKMKAVTALEVTESHGSSIAGFVYSPSGTRTVAFFHASFSPPAGGATTVTLNLHRPASTPFSLPDVVGKIVALPVGAQAPWEADNV